MPTAYLNLQRTFLNSRCGKAGVILLVAVSLQSASAEIRVAPDFPMTDAQEAKKSDPADILVQSYRKDVLANSAKAEKTASTTLTASKG